MNAQIDREVLDAMDSLSETINSHPSIFQELFARLAEGLHSEEQRRTEQENP